MNYKLITFKDTKPTIHKSAFLASGVIIAADVTIAENVNIWFNSVIRGDVSPVTIGKNTNIQDGSVIHTSRFNGPTHIGDNVTVGHLALLHACIIEDNAFIGMQAAVMDKVVVEEYGFVGAGSLVSPGKIVKKKELWIGRPAKFVRMITDEELEFMQENIKNYLELSNEYKK
tara:strand:- start:4382 stop:4897 length:516 start_codon:yes stop_codon:yes gene_type:complete